MEDAIRNTLCENFHIRKYDIQLEQIPRLHYQDPKIDELIEKNRPVVITDSNLVKPAVDKWTLDYLNKNMGDVPQTVYESKNHVFKYYDAKKILTRSNHKGVEFHPPIKKLEMPISEFIERLKLWQPGDNRIYLQHFLSTRVGNAILDDFSKFNWDFIHSKQTKFNWGPLTSNLLFIGMEGNVTPCHYDEQENFFAQVSGSKRCILFGPEEFESLYPYPVYHPHDRQSMVDFDNPDHRRFPKFKSAQGCEAVIGPGDVLYIPVSWWHHIESLLSGGPTITVNFWYKSGPTSREYPLQDSQKVTIMRNIEKMILEVLQDPKQVGPLLRAMVVGRYTNDGDS